MADTAHTVLSPRGGHSPHVPRHVAHIAHPGLGSLRQGPARPGTHGGWGLPVPVPGPAADTGRLPQPQDPPRAQPARPGTRGRHRPPDPTPTPREQQRAQPTPPRTRGGHQPPAPVPMNHGVPGPPVPEHVAVMARPPRSTELRNHGRPSPPVRNIWQTLPAHPGPGNRGGPSPPVPEQVVDITPPTHPRAHGGHRQPARDHAASPPGTRGGHGLPTLVPGREAGQAHRSQGMRRKLPAHPGRHVADTAHLVPGHVADIAHLSRHLRWTPPTHPTARGGHHPPAPGSAAGRPARPRTHGGPTVPVQDLRQTSTPALVQDPRRPGPPPLSLNTWPTSPIARRVREWQRARPSHPRTKQSVASPSPGPEADTSRPSRTRGGHCPPAPLISRTMAGARPAHPRTRGGHQPPARSRDHGGPGPPIPKLPEPIPGHVADNAPTPPHSTLGSALVLAARPRTPWQTSPHARSHNPPRAWDAHPPGSHGGHHPPALDPWQAWPTCPMTCGGHCPPTPRQAAGPAHPSGTMADIARPFRDTQFSQSYFLSWALYGSY
ncbi:basic proline-rich protein-like [Macrobrachium nipponense]|uniref:basic proline-rich protein-like n=1 Tax=Macrobrachium nipponense TaxID=159736 RepID=UPI0030C8289C